MTPATDLFFLIKSLNGSQKRYFRLFSKLHSGNKVYLRLFDSIEKQQEYDEGAIKTEFAGEVFIKQLTRTKYYLYQLILKSMRAYHTQHTSQKQLREMLDDIEFLYAHHLHAQCEKLIKKAKEIARRHEKETYLLELIAWESNLATNPSHKKYTFEQMDRVNRDKVRLLSGMYRDSEIRMIRSRMSVEILKHGFTRNKGELKKLEKFFRHPMFKDSKSAGSYFAKIDIYYMQSTYYFYRNEHKKAFDVCKKIIAVMESRPVIIKERMQSYISALQNICTLLIHSRNFSDWRIYNDKLITLKSEFTLSPALFTVVFNIEIGFYVQFGLLNEAMALYKSDQHRFNEIEHKSVHPQDRKIFFLFMSRLFFGIQDYKTANIWVNKIMHDENQDTREDIYCISRLYSLVIHFELSKQELLEYEVKSTIRFLSRRSRLYKLESVMLGFLKKYLLKMTNSEETKILFKELKRQLDILVKDPYERKAIVFFDFQSWAESKAYNKPFSEIIRQKAIGYGAL